MFLPDTGFRFLQLCPLEMEIAVSCVTVFLTFEELAAGFPLDLDVQSLSLQPSL